MSVGEEAGVGVAGRGGGVGVVLTGVGKGVETGFGFGVGEILALNTFAFSSFFFSGVAGVADGVADGSANTIRKERSVVTGVNSFITRTSRAVARYKNDSMDVAICLPCCRGVKLANTPNEATSSVLK